MTRLIGDEMSRTYAHVPHAVRAWRARHTNEAEVFHDVGCETSNLYQWAFYRNVESHPCNADEYNPRLRHAYGRRRTSGQCEWNLKYPYPWSGDVGLSGVRRSYRDKFNGRQRVNVRDVSRAAAKEYNGSGDCEPEYVDGRTRHSVVWDMD
jgi:hypothetical protein